MKTGGVYLGFHTLRGRKFPYGNFRTSVFCEVKTQIVGKTKFFDSLRTEDRVLGFDVYGGIRSVFYKQPAQPVQQAALLLRGVLRLLARHADGH